MSQKVQEIIETLDKIVKLEEELKNIKLELRRAKKKISLKTKHNVGEHYWIIDGLRKLNLSEEEEIEVLKYWCRNNIEFACNYLTISSNNDVRDQAIECLIDNPTILLETINNWRTKDCFNDDDKEKIYSRLKDYYIVKLDKNVVEFYDFCVFFNEYLDYGIKCTLVERVIKRNSNTVLANLINYNICNLPQDLMDKLEAYHLMNKLR